MIQFVFKFLLIVTATFFMAGCSPETKYRILSTLFDGVPPPASRTAPKTTAAAKDSTAKPASLTMAAPKPRYSIHPPYRDKECDACHERERGNRLTDPLPDLCYGCHDDFRDSLAYLHGPVAAGQCTACHNPHMTKKPHLLKHSGNALCLFCHDKNRLAQTKTHADKMGQNCQQCHDPHGSAKKFYLSRR